MKASAEITKDKELKIYVDLTEENATASSGTPNVWVSNLQVFNTESYLDNVPVFEVSHGSSIWFDENGKLVLTEHDLNVFDTARNQESCHPTSLLNDIMVIQLSFEYEDEYSLSQSCCNLIGNTSIALYYPCPIYQAAVDAMNGCDCNSMCEDNLPYGFMYALLKKKAVDSCIGAGLFENACRYYSKFFKGGCGCVRKDCGCGSKAYHKKSQT